MIILLYSICCVLHIILSYLLECYVQYIVKMDVNCFNDYEDRGDQKGGIQGGAHRTAVYLGEVSI